MAGAWVFCVLSNYELNNEILEQKQYTNKIEIWGGVECTAARIEDKLYDQLLMNGHEQRPDDLNLFKDIGISTIRYPILWEKSIFNEKNFFELHSKRLRRLNELNIRPIAGLMHHGSGPSFTSLIDPQYPELLAVFARKVAEHFPEIELYTPVNEPLTTARFSGLYGMWYPHARNDEAFVRIFCNQMKAIVLSILEIRKVQAKASLVQTEDLCKIKSTTLMQYQADFENNRRWLTYDFLTGKFTAEHPLWNYFVNNGIKEEELRFFLENRMDPAICGFNYYVTSERFLDHRIYLYPKRYWGGNGRDKYADVETVRVKGQQLSGYVELFKEAWDRYKLPLAITEVHLGCTREEQIRWFHEAYNASLELKSQGVDMKAITVWSLLGSFDWNSLMKSYKNFYETGAFDIRSGKPRQTAIAKFIKAIHEGKEFQNSLLQVPGWWKRESRVTFPNKKINIQLSQAQYELEMYKGLSPLLIIGATDSLGKAFAKVCSLRGIVFKLANQNQIDITSKESIEAYLKTATPWAIINAAGFSDIDEAEKNPKMCFVENTIGPTILAEICKNTGIRLVSFSTDQVFNGKKKNPYKEDDPTNPLNIYGQSKRMAERRILSINQDTLIIRSSTLFNPWYYQDSVAQLIHNSRNSNHQQLFASDIIVSPTYLPDLVNTTLDLLIDKEAGIWHLSSEEEFSYYDFAKMALRINGISDENIYSAPSSLLKFTAERPAYSVLMSSGGVKLPPLDQALKSYMRELKEEKFVEKILNESSL